MNQELRLRGNPMGEPTNSLDSRVMLPVAIIADQLPCETVIATFATTVAIAWVARNGLGAGCPEQPFVETTSPAKAGLFLLDRALRKRTQRLRGHRVSQSGRNQRRKRHAKTQRRKGQKSLRNVFGRSRTLSMNKLELTLNNQLRKISGQISFYTVHCRFLLCAFACHSPL